MIKRLLFFLAAVIIPVMLSWWLFIPLTILSVYLFGAPYEVILAAVILDSFYYFGSSWLLKFPLTIFSLILISLALFLRERIKLGKLL